MAGLDLTKYKNKQVEKLTTQEENKDSFFDFLNKDIKLFKPKLPDKQKEEFYLELKTLLSSGVDIRSTLELIEQEQTKDKFKKIFKAIREDVIKGFSLSQALQNTDYFTPYEYFSIQIGEESGKLPKVLEQLASYYTSKMKQKRQLVGALSYPILILSTSIGAVVFMLSFIVPMFSDVFKRFGGELPKITQMIITLSAVLRENLYLIFLGILGFVVFILLSRKKAWFSKYSAWLLVRVPLFGNIFSNIYLARFCNSMGLLIGSKVPLLRAIQLVKQMIEFYPINQSLDRVENDILNGESLNESLSKFSFYTPRMIALLKVGEEVNQLDVFFDKLAKNFSEEAEHKTGLLSTLLEPVMIIFLGAIVGFILIAMYLPMFELSTNIGQ